MACRYVLSVVLALMAGFSTGAIAQVNTVGAVRVAMDARILRGDMVIDARAGAPLAVMDTLVTGPSGAIGIVLKDNSVISLGPNSNFRLTEFAFEPKEGKLALLGELARGTLEYISGKISKIARDAAKFRTPYTTIAVRGTRILVRAGE
jgi:hypothetical protein